MKANTPKPRKTLSSLFALLALACAPAAAAQEEIRRVERPVAQVQEVVRQRIMSERDGRDEYVVFNKDARITPLSPTHVSVRGTGAYYHDGRRADRERREEFTYSAIYARREDRVERPEYSFEERRGDREVPRWLVGAFRGRNPSGRQRALVTVEEDGRVAVVYGDGARALGTYRDRQLRVGSAVWNVSRYGDGFRAQDASTRRAENFVRVEAGPLDAGNVRVPSWAVGTFRGTTDGGESELTINRDGSATITSLGTHAMHSGRYADGVLTFTWGSFNVTREAGGIRTVQVNNRRRQTSYRRVN